MIWIDFISSAAMLQASEAALGKSTLGVGGGGVVGGGGGGGGGVGSTDQVLNLSRSNKSIQMNPEDEEEDEEEEDAIDDHDDLDDADDVDDDEPQDLIVTPQVKH